MTISCLLQCRVHKLITYVIKICSMVIMWFSDPVVICYLIRLPLQYEWQQAMQGQNPLCTEITTDVCVLPMSRSNLSSRWNSKYIRTTVPHSATSVGFEYLLGHNMPVVTGIYKLSVQKIMYQMYIMYQWVHYPPNNCITNFNHTCNELVFSRL